MLKLTLVTPIHYSIAAKAFSLNQPEIFCSTLSLAILLRLSTDQSSLFSLHLIARMQKCVCECDDLYLALQCEYDDLFQALQTYVRTYVHQGRIEPPQCVVFSPHALALGNKYATHLRFGGFSYLFTLPSVCNLYLMQK